MGEVDAYLQKVEMQNKENISLLKQKLEDLANENLELRKTIAVLKEKEQSVSEALLLAGEKAKEQEALLYKKLKNEETRLQTFANRWTSFINEQTSSKDVLSKKYLIEEYLKNAETELVQELNKHFTYLPPLTAQEAQYISEAKRLARNSLSDLFD